MATLNELVRLFSAVAEDDVPRAKRVATSIAQTAEKKGHRSAAQLLRNALHSRQESRNAVHHTAPIPISFVQSVLTRLDSDVDLEDVSLTPKLRDEVLSLIEEHVLREQLQAKGLRNRSRLLFSGPPGCGKSMTARAIGKAMGLPTFVVRFDALIGSYLGQTAQNIRTLFNFIENTPAIVLIDEVDALGTHRGSERDIGELDRIVISMMQHLELIRPAAFLICTSNLPESLDAALLRRFDAVLEFARPSPSRLGKYANHLAEKRGFNASAKVLKRASQAKSFADSERIVLDEYRRHVLLHARKGEG